MRIELSLASADRVVDVAITAPGDTPLGAVLPHVLQAGGGSQHQRVWHRDAPLDPALPLEAAGLRLGSRLSLDRDARSLRRPGVLALHVVGGPTAGHIVPLERGRFTVGRAPDCDIVIADPDVSRRHARLDVTPAAITLIDLDSTNGTTVDGRPVPNEGVHLSVGCLIAMGDSLLSVAGPLDAPASVQPGADGRVLLLRPPRRDHSVPPAEIVLPSRTNGPRPRTIQWVSALLPAVGGVALAWFAHAPQFLLFALLSPVMMIGTAVGDRIHGRRDRRREAGSYRQRRAAAQRRIAAALAAEAVARRAAAPDPAAVLRQAMLPGTRVWERRRSDPDLLRVRVGCAALPSTLLARDGPTVTPAGSLPATPLCVDLRAGPLGVSGPPELTAALGRWLVGQVATLHSPVDVELALLLSEDRCAQWEWARWLPQLHDRVAICPEQWTRLIADLDTTIDHRLAARQHDAQGWSGSWIVLVVDRAGELSELPGLAGLLARGALTGITAVCIDADAAALPTSCAAVASVHGVTGTRLVVRKRDGDEVPAVIDEVSADWALELARSLAPLVDAGAPEAGSIPERCSMLEELDLARPDPAEIAGRWKASGGGARAVLGRGADGPVIVDLGQDGPHALIAGTTGAGKSELLQCLVAGLAVHAAPDDLNFLLIDYKGGAAFADCARLPHTAGLVTDLDPYLTERALRALSSELRRRERLFAEAGVADLPAYRAASAPEPIPRLVIVVDEFAALADELPDFVRGLVGVAQRGRSLGVHLVLATQRPGHAVSAEIRANTSLRIALRVTDPSESNDVIDSPLAATIDRTTPGRAYLRVGGTLTCFQTPHAGGTSAHDRGRISVEVLGPWRRAAAAPDPHAAATDLARLVDAVRAAAEGSGRRLARSPWLAPLPTALPRAALGPSAADATVALGWLDLPDEQRRETLTVDLAGGALLVVGAPRSGRTSTLVSLGVGAAEQLAPDRLHLHVIDPTGTAVTALRPLPHCATLLGPQELALAPRLLRLLDRDVSARLAQPAPATRAYQLLLVDGWDALCAGLSDADAAHCFDALTALLRVGSAAGVAVAVTGDRSLLAPRIAGGFAERIVLRLADRGDYALAGVPARDVPARLSAGRGIRTGDRSVIQLAHVGAGLDSAAVHAAVASVVAQWPDRRPDDDAICIRPLPGRVALAEVPNSAGRFVLGLAGDRLEPLAVDPFAGSARLLVAGPPRSGRTTVLRSLVRQAQLAGIRTLVAATARSPLTEDARRLDIPVLAPTAGDVGPVPADPTLLLVDDSEAFAESPAGEALTSWLRSAEAPLAAVVSGRADDVATSFRGLAAEVRRSQCGILLRPGPVDGELLGVRLPRQPASGPPGRGVAVGDPSWGPLFADGEPVPLQVAAP